MQEGRIQWHPAFAAVLRIELEEEAENLLIEEEHLLSQKPMQVDILVIKKKVERVMKKNIARIFKKHNIIEYKSPDDSLSINDFYKVFGYACFYQSDTERVGEIDPEEITITFVCNSYPRKMLEHVMKTRNMKIEKQEEGIYYLSGGMFPVQLLVTKQLSQKENYWLQNLRKDLKSGGEIERLMEAYESKKGVKWYEAAMDVIMRANWAEVEEEKKMCEALKELFAEELQESREEGIELAKKVFRLAKENMTIAEIAVQCQVSEEKVRRILE